MCKTIIARDVHHALTIAYIQNQVRLLDFIIYLKQLFTHL